jgi:hypothetical protein
LIIGNPQVVCHRIVSSDYTPGIECDNTVANAGSGAIIRVYRQLAPALENPQSMKTMKRKKISSSLEKIARSVRDSDEFVGHIANIADRYRREYALETGPRGKDVRRTLKAFRKHATGLTQWLGQAQVRQSSLEYEALTKIGAVMHSAPNQTLASSVTIIAWLDQAERSAALAEAQLGSKKAQINAHRIAIEALRATFEHHGLKWSTQVTKTSASDAVKLLCAIAKSAGDEMTPDDARAAMSGPKPTK